MEMKLFTEADARTGYFVKKQRCFTVPPGTRVSEEAKLFLDRYGLRLEFADAPASANAQAAVVKPDELTHLRAGELVAKDDPRIAFRGMLDSTEAMVLQAAYQAEQHGCAMLSGALLEVLALLRRAMAADVKNEPLGSWTLFGLNPDELRARSHHPERYYGVAHSAPTLEQGAAALALNLLRARLRELELAFSRAFLVEGRMRRPDLAELLNRLSSGVYLLYCQELAKQAALSPADGLRIEIEVSARHVHLCPADVEALFGPGHRLTKKKDLSQTGEFLCEERVCLRGPKGSLEHVAVLGPERAATQVELARSDARQMGIKAPLRLSGDLRGAADCLICSEHNELAANSCVIVARNHIHMTPDDAAALHLRDRELVDVRVDGERPLVFADVTVRVAPSFRKYMHVDVDEANAAMLEGPAYGRVLVRKG